MPTATVPPSDDRTALRDRLEDNRLYHFNVFTGCRGHSWPAGLRGTTDRRHYPAVRSCHCSQFDLISLPQLDLNHCNSSTLYQLTVKLISLDFVCTDQKWLSRRSRVPMSQKTTWQLQRTQHGKLEDESLHLATMSQDKYVLYKLMAKGRFMEILHLHWTMSEMCVLHPRLTRGREQTRVTNLYYTYWRVDRIQQKHCWL